MPDDIVEEDFDQKVINKDAEGDEHKESQIIHRKKNVNETAVVLLKPGQVQEEEEVKLEIDHGDDGDEQKAPTQTVIKTVEQDQNHKALAVQGRDIQGMPGTTILVINKYAGRAYREEFLEYINRTYPEFFDENDDLEGINLAINQRA